MGWEIKDSRFFCNTSDTHFGPYLDCSIWPDHDCWMPSNRDDLFHECFNRFLANNPQKRRGSLETDPRAMTEKYLEKIVCQFENEWLQMEDAVRSLVEFSERNQLDTLQTVKNCAPGHSEGEPVDIDFTPKKTKTKKKKARSR